MDSWSERADKLVAYMDYIYEQCKDPIPPSIHERITLSKHRERKRSFEEQREYIASEWMGQGKGSEVSPSKDRRTFCVGEAVYDWDETTRRYELRPKRSWLSIFLEFMKWK
jgi:hypothetical protein